VDRAVFERRASEPVRLDPNYVIAYVCRWDAYSKHGNLDRAISDYNEAIRLDPTDTLGYLARGIAYTKQGKFNKANADFTTAKRLRPNQ